MHTVFLENDRKSAGSFSFSLSDFFTVLVSISSVTVAVFVKGEKSVISRK